MAHTVSKLAPTAITREALRRLHQKLSFVGTITREYDDSYSRLGAKVGDRMMLRRPGSYTPLGKPDQRVEVKASHIYGVDAQFTGADLAMTMDEFSDRVLEEPMARVARQIEAATMPLYQDVWQQVTNIGQHASFAKVLMARKMLVDSLAPLSGRTCSLNVHDTGDLADALKGLFNDRDGFSRQYRDGFMGRTAGFDFMGEAAWPTHDPAQGIGNVFTIEGVYRVHPDTKQSTGQLQQFVTTADGYAPRIVEAGPNQNVSCRAGFDPDSRIYADIAPHGISMAYHKTAFLFGSADLPFPRGVDFAAREVFDGISLRLVRQYDVNAERFPCRFEVLFGAVTDRPHLACRLANR